VIVLFSPGQQFLSDEFCVEKLSASSVESNTARLVMGLLLKFHVVDEALCSQTDKYFDCKKNYFYLVNLEC